MHPNRASVMIALVLSLPVLPACDEPSPTPAAGSATPATAPTPAPAPAEPPVNPDELVPNPVYTAWARHKPGTAVMINVHSGPERRTIGGAFFRLEKLTPQYAEVRVSTSMVDQEGKEQFSPYTIQQIPAMTKRSALPSPPPGAEKGEEDLVVGGKTYKTTWWRAKVTRGDKQFFDQRWYAAEFPGYSIKSTDINASDPADRSGMDYTIVSGKP